MPKCIYENCIRVVKAGSKHKDCYACRARYKYWEKKPVAHRLERRRKLMLSGETMAEFVPDTALRQQVKKLHKKEVVITAREEKANGRASE